MKVYQRLAHAFKAEGTTAVFGIMGDANMYWMHELNEVGVQLIEVRHEGAGLGMADGWARVTHTPAVATATCGPGISQLATAMLVAARASSPLVIFGGEHPLNDPEYNQHLDNERFAAACECGFVRITSPDLADECVRKAFYMARVESRPVMLSAPMDIQQKTFEDDDEAYVPSTALLTRQAVQPDAEGLARAADLLASSKKPVIVVGRGAQWSGAGDAVIRLAKRIGALIATSLQVKTWLSQDEFHVGISGFYGTKTAMQLFEEADCVLAVGASMNRYTIEHGYLYPNAKYIHMDVKPHIVMGNGKAADIYLQSDGRAGVEALDALLAKRSVQSTGLRTPEVKERLKGHFADRAKFEIEPGTVDPREVILALDEIVPEHVGLSTGSGATTGFSNMLFTKRRPFVICGHYFGCIGQMMPAAMGACVGTGNKPVLLVDGDASMMMHLAEFETAVRCDMPILMVCLNNEALGSEYYKLDVHNMKKELSAIPTPDLGAVAKAMGGRGALARSVDDVKKAAQEWVKKPGPMMIDVRISRSVVTLPYRRVHYGKDE
jgi:thiamine pyrophosphate-dependent acetolactate synthase large subunit-like protein